jgi:WD40 repeat protein/predicted Ser/Thr protein kinase
MPEPSPEAVEALFHQVADLEPEQLGAFLDERCGSDSELRAAVVELLHFDAKAKCAPDFLSSPANLVRAALPLGAEAVPASLGRYRILRLQGQGGMGSVYEAEQDNPRRTVALKVIRPGVLSPELLSRFSHEAQILARLQHPGIAQVYEAGMSEDGRPFFAMEFIRGMPLDEHARSRGLDAEARLDLLAKVCDAVQHAHDKGVIHRDLKPGNILVDASGQPKVLDFGVAHVTAADLVTSSSRTHTGQLLGTLTYMSPEQVAGRPTGLDGRSDVYTLGVILFELLAHRLPYQLEQLPVHEVARVIQQEEPSRLGSVDTRYRGDVEIIVAKTLEKDKTRRYASAGDLASDIRRHLRGDVILARPASALYQLRKFARRHKALVAGALGIFAALLAGTIVSILFAWRAADNARAADRYARAADRYARAAGENARVANERERAATYQTYRARIAAAVAALLHHDVTDAARQLVEAPAECRDWEWRHLKSRLDDSTAMFAATAGEHPYLIQGPDGIRIATWTPTSLRVRDLEGNELLARSWRPESHSIGQPPILTRQGLLLLASGWESAIPTPTIAQASDGATKILKLLDHEGRVRTKLKGPPGRAEHLVAASPDGSRLAVLWSGAKGWVLTLYDADSGKPGASTSHDFSDIWALVFSPDGTRVATAGEDGVIRLWDTSTGTMSAPCRGHSRKVLSVAFRQDGKRLVTASADGTVRQWDSTTGREVESPYERHTGEVVAAVYSPDGLWVASGGTDRTVRVWVAADRHDVGVLHGHTGVVSQLAFTADGRRLASASHLVRDLYAWDATVRIWEVGRPAGASVLLGHTSYVYPVAYSPDGQWIASGGWDNSIRLWDAVTGESCAVLPHPGFVRALSFSPDSSWLVSGCDRDESLHIWNVATAQLENKLKTPGRLYIQAIAVSPDGAHVAAGDSDGTARIMETATGAEVYSFRMPWGGAKKSLAYNSNGRLLASTGEEPTQIDLWDTEARRRSARLTGHTGFVYSVAFSSDGRLLASTSGDRTVRVWDVAAAKCVAVLTGHSDDVFSAVFHPDGHRLASAGRDRAIWLWDLSTGQEVGRLEGHTNYVFSLAFSPDGGSLVSGSGDGTVRLWDTEPPAHRHEARREAEALRPDAERLVDALFRETKNDPAKVVAAVRANRSLSEPQRNAALRAVLRRSSAPSDGHRRG